MAKYKLLVSACLLGESCRYDGRHNRNAQVCALQRSFDLIPVCPECFGNLPTPRDPAEICGARVLTRSGADVTGAFCDGAEKTLYIAEENNCFLALLKERSPSCGCGRIYDGTFSSRLIDGNGVTADLLLQHGITVYGESQVDRLLDMWGEEM